MFAMLALFIALLAACSDATDNDEASPAGSDGGSGNADTDGSNAAPAAEIVNAGFAQGEYTTQAMVIVTTETEAAVGEFVTASVNFLDANGQILATAEQVESFNWVGQELALPVTPSGLDGNAKVASIDPSVSMSDYGTTEEARDPLPVLDSTEIKKGEYGGFTASFALTNETDADLKSPRLGIVCYNAADKIIGGTSTYPNVVPAGKTVRIDAEPTVSAKPASCRAFVNYEA